MSALFNPDDYPPSADPVRAWRQAEAELLRLQAEADAEGEVIEAIENEDDIGVLTSHPVVAEGWHPTDPALCPWCRQEARMEKLRELKRRVEELGAAALRACKE